MKRFLWASYSMYFLGGMTSVFFGAILPELLSHYQVSYTTGGLLILLQSIGFIIGVPITTKLMDRYPYRFILSGSALAVTLAQAGILGLPHFYWLEVLVILNGMGASALETAVASYVMELYKGRRAIYMSRLEVSFGLGALGFPIVASALIAIHGWRFSAIIVGGLALILAIFWQTISVTLEEKTEETSRKDAVPTYAPIFQSWFSKYAMLLLFLLLIFVYVGVEGSLNSFLPSIFIVKLKASPDLASLSSSMFWGAMVIGRLLIGQIVQRVSYEKYIMGSLIFAIVFFLLLALSHSLLGSFLIVFGIGISLSAVYSITMVFANHTFPGMERIVTSAVTAFAGIGGAVFPAMIGYIMDHFLPNQVLWIVLAVTTLLLVLIVAIIVSLRLNSWTKQAKKIG